MNFGLGQVDYSISIKCLSACKYMLKLPAMKIYSQPVPSTKGYVFFASSIWKQEPMVNDWRKRFIRCAKTQPGIRFEGGFCPRVDGLNFDPENEMLPKRYAPKQFIQRASDSSINFNCPAVRGAISWRLGELLNMGKLILTLPFRVKLANPLEHNVHCWYLDDISNCRNALTDIQNSEPLVHRMQDNALDYFNRYCLPEKQIDRIISTAFNLVPAGH